MATRKTTASAADVDVAAVPIRIPPQLGPTGAPLELDPPCGGSWRRDADGGLSPADESTARAAGLAWATEPTPE